MEVIRSEGLGKRYGRAVAVDGLDLAVGEGQVYGFLGPNGSGKTTTMRMLLGLIRPTSGRAWLVGRRLPDPAGLARVGAMIEEPAFHPWLSGRRNLEALALSGPPLPRPGAVESVLERAGLGAVAGRKVRTYSQGMRQRLGLALALMRDPAVVLLDEPMNGMDPAGIREFRTLVRSLADGGTTVFLSSHQLGEVELVCDRVAVLRAGRLVEEGRVGDLSRAMVRVVVAPGDQERACRLLAARFALRTEGPDSVLVDCRDGRAVNEALGSGGVWPHEVRVERAGLEDLFLGLTGGADPGAGGDTGGDTGGGTNSGTNSGTGVGPGGGAGASGDTGGAGRDAGQGAADVRDEEVGDAPSAR
ncbi:ABC transporter ATP-binding protein [Streptomyces sp. HPF1205]|uniref:ABC transporter ATP-binding protein n=1 Tax=Streptomyces sp. HPF1205 TaxID=2873262 RepID=UPI001CEDCA2B|nr:ABC transporter ATP-binding protein [Streptomyces sp. HPF1205]